MTAGINKENGTREENFHFHDLRSCYATELLRHNVNPHVIKQLFGHSAMAITDIYIAEDMEILSEATKRLDNEPEIQSDIVQ